MTTIESSTCFEHREDISDDDSSVPSLVPRIVATSDSDDMLFMDHQFVTLSQANLDHSDHLRARGPRFRYGTRLCENLG
jgi:hypothetical protein